MTYVQHSKLFRRNFLICRGLLSVDPLVAARERANDCYTFWNEFYLFLKAIRYIVRLSKNIKINDKASLVFGLAG